MGCCQYSEVFFQEAVEAASRRWNFRQVVLGNQNPVCTFPYYQGQIQSNAGAGNFITHVSATDPNGLAITVNQMPC